LKTSAFDKILVNLSEDSEDIDIAQVVTYASQNDLAINEVVSLARKLAFTGSWLPGDANITVDVPSTGGPSSLSTLICPLFLRLKGFAVPKLAVPGRPAGGVDVLATVPGYRTDLNRDEVIQCLAQCQYAHFRAGHDFVPLDARMFAIRQQMGSQDNPHLVIASLISKKLAAAVVRVRLDVRVGPHGNFGSTIQEARENARMFNHVARMVGLDSACYLTDAKSIYQPYIGRGEALVALDDLFNNQASVWLAEHIQSCWEMTENPSTSGGYPEGSALREIFADNLAAQGSSIREFSLRVDDIRGSNKETIRARSKGHLQIDIPQLRRLLVQTQASFPSGRALFSDPCGVELLCRPGQEVEAGQPIALVRGIDKVRGIAGATGVHVDSVISIIPTTDTSDHSFAPFNPEWVQGGTK
jgi:pyrimidine-nucleoside phosphorylase